MRAARRGLVAGLMWAGAARAESVDQVLLAGTCVPEGASANDVVQILAAELSPVPVAPFTAGPVSEHTVLLGIEDCTLAPSSARISVWNRAERRERVVPLADAAPGTESRTLALALAEALRDPTVTRPSPRGPLPLLFLPPPPAVSAPTPPPPLLDERARRSPPVAASRASGGITPRADLLFRYLPSSATPALGVRGEVDAERFGAGFMVLGARKSAELGTATLVALGAVASFRVMDFTESTSLRVESELGAALAVGSPATAAEGHTRAALHAALLGGVAQAVPLGAGYDLLLFAGGGYATSLNADADGHRLAGLNGGFVALEAGVRF